MFWGTDSLVHLEDFLSGKGPSANDLPARWESLPASARRTAP